MWRDGPAGGTLQATCGLLPSKACRYYNSLSKQQSISQLTRPRVSRLLSLLTGGWDLVPRTHRGAITSARSEKVATHIWASTTWAVEIDLDWSHHITDKETCRRQLIAGNSSCRLRCLITTYRQLARLVQLELQSKYSRIFLSMPGFQAVSRVGSYVGLYVVMQRRPITAPLLNRLLRRWFLISTVEECDLCYNSSCSSAFFCIFFHTFLFYLYMESGSVYSFRMFKVPIKATTEHDERSLPSFMCLASDTRIASCPPG